MKKYLTFLIVFVIIIVGILIYSNLIKKGEKVPSPEEKISMPSNTTSTGHMPKVVPPSAGQVEVDILGMPEKTLKKVVMIIAYRNFRDQEYFVPKEILEGAGVEVKTASNRMGTAIGAEGGDVEVDLLVSQIKPAELADLQSKSSRDSIQSISSFDAIVFVGGQGCLDALDNEDSYKLARETVSQNKVLASICISPVILAKAGVLEGKKATVWSSVMDKSSIKILEEQGAIYLPRPVVSDGKIVTGNGPDAAKEFGEKIIEGLTQ